jgi:hypothetical protein
VSFQLFAGRTARFTADAVGSSPLVYQWKRDGTDVSGATEPYLTLNNVSGSDMGQYTVVVTNSEGAITSSPPATLNVISPTPSSYAHTMNGYNPWRMAPE